MNAFEKVLHFVSAAMEAPDNYGWFHLMFVFLLIAVCVVVALFAKKVDKKRVEHTVFGVGIFCLAMEIVKQLLFSFSYSPETGVEWSYQWYAFPFQFCSVPMYIMIISFLVKNEKVRGAMYSFLAVFGIFGGLVVMVYPNDVFTTMIYIDFQTMLHHSSQIVVAVLLFASGIVKPNFFTVLKGSIVFVCCVAVALALDLLFPLLKVEGTFNMFFISPYFPCHLPILGDVYAKLPYVAFLFVYVFGFGVCACVMILFAKLFFAVGKLFSMLVSGEKSTKNI